MARGKLRVYLGAAPGVGKTYAMLNEGRRAAERGRDVVVGIVETHGRPNTADQERGLEVLARRTIVHRERAFEEMDLAAIVDRHPSLVLVDELAHTNVTGSRHEKRWQDVVEILQAGIAVVTTLNIAHLESLNDVVRQITGVTQRETVPDGVVRAADQIELIDMSPESLRRRMAHGNIYPPDRVDTALANYFRIGNLTALRELALLWVADRVDEGLKEYRERHGIGEPWETKERVVVALAGSARGERLIRRGARMAARSRADLVGVHVRPTDGLAARDAGALEHNRVVLGQLGGRYAEVSGSDVPAALVAFARAENATQLLLGATGRSRWNELVQGSVINQVIRRADGIDVHVLSARDDEPASAARLPRLPERRQLARLSGRRRVAGWILAGGVAPLLTLLFAANRGTLGGTGGLPELLFAVVVVAVVGGLLPALVSGLLAFVLADWYLIPPFHRLSVSRAGNVAALISFLVVAALVSAVIDRLSRRSAETARARAESEAFARLAGGAVLAPQEALPSLVDQLRSTFGVDAVAVLEPRADNPDWTVVAATGTPVPTRPDEAAFSAELAEGSVLAVTGERLTADDRRLLAAFVTQLVVVQEQQRLRRTASAVENLEVANELRTALLAAVSHDLRSPLASIKASATSLLDSEIDWDADDRRAFVESIDMEADRLDHLIANLLDMSRLQTGVLPLRIGPVGLDEVAHAAVASLSGDTGAIDIEVAESLTAVLADAALLERAVANLLANALTWSPTGHMVMVRGSQLPPEEPDADGHDGPATGGPSTSFERSPADRSPADRSPADRSPADRSPADRSPAGPPAAPGSAPPVLSADRRHLACRGETAGVQLHIVDTGPGIDPDDRERVFQPFQRLGGGRDADANGVGLGLAVARGFVDLMGGSLVLDDTPGGGLTAVITLPAAPRSAVARPAPDPPTPDPPTPGPPTPAGPASARR